MPLPPLVMAEALMFNLFCKLQGWFFVLFMMWSLGLASSFEGYRKRRVTVFQTCFGVSGFRGEGFRP